MSPEAKETIKEKFFKLQKNIEALEELQNRSQEDIAEDLIIQNSVLHGLYVSIEIILDVGSYILSEYFNSPAKNYREIIELLGQKEVIPQEFAQANADMAPFRNRVAHDYDQLDIEKVYLYLQKAPTVFYQFMDHYNSFMKNN